MGSIRIVQVGLGPLGRRMVESALRRPGFAVTGAVDTDPELKGRPLKELCELPGGSASEETSRVRVSGSLGEALREAGSKPDVALLATVSDLNRLAPQLEQILAFRLPVVSTCEELVYPWMTHPRLAGRIDRLARRRKVAVLATGVNPGFLMDTLPILLSAVCQRVDAVRVSRIQDASVRRLSFQKKIGAGLSLEEFEERRRAGVLRHVGLSESMHMICARMGWVLERTEEALTPVVAERRMVSGELTVEPGQASGVQQVGRGYVRGEERIRLLFRASVGESSPEDRVEILGEPPLVFTVPKGIHGDVATCAIALNAIPRILEARPGLRTMIDIAPVSFFS